MSPGSHPPEIHAAPLRVRSPSLRALGTLEAQRALQGSARSASLAPRQVLASVSGSASPAPAQPRPSPGRPVLLPLTESGGAVLGQDGRHLAAGSAGLRARAGNSAAQKPVASAASPDRQTLGPGEEQARRPHALVTATWHARALALLPSGLRVPRG